VIDALIKGEAHLRSPGSEYSVATGAFMLLSSVTIAAVAFAVRAA
jgi:hypothetical protein